MAGDQGDEDPFEGLTLDDAFVEGAALSEPSARQRIEDRARAEAEHRRRLDDREVELSALDDRLRRRARRRSRSPLANRWARLVTIGVLLGVFAGVVAWNAGRARPVSDLVRSDTVVDGAVVVTDRPPAGAGASATPLGAPPPVARESSAHRFVQTQPSSGEPVAWDPCRPVHIVVNGRTSVPGADLALEEALGAASRATGLQLVLDGPTDEAPTEGRAAYQPERYPDRWAPVLVAWSDPSESPRLAGDVQGWGGSSSLAVPGSPAVYVTGSVTLDGPDLAELARLPGGHAAVRAVIEHELGHVLGLDHVEDPTQLMNPVGGWVTTYADGDLTGLAKLGRGPCVPEV